jgi:hypothetical protein
MKRKKIFVVFLAAILSASSLLGETIEREHYIYHASSKRYLEIVDSSIAAARQRLINIFGDSLNYKPDIYIFDNLSNFKEKIGTAFPDWGAAAALPYRRLIALKSPAHFNLGKSLSELVMHEYAHLWLHEILNPAEPPRWLDEGVAMFVAYEWGWSANFDMSKAVVFNALIPLEEIKKLNRFSEGKARTAYAESYLAVKYLLDIYERETFNTLLDSLRSSRSFDMAIKAAIGGNAEEFEEEFFDNLKQRYNIMSLFGDLYFLWILLAAIVFFGALYKLLRKKSYYKKWEEEDRLQSRDFDYGDPDNPEQIDDEDRPWA